MMRQRSSKGFTLIEILIVIVIISITAGVAVMTLSMNQHKKFELVSQRMVNLILLAEEEAMLRSVILGFTVSAHSFQFYEYQHDAQSNENHWQAVTNLF